MAKTARKETGDLGEEIAVRFLREKGYQIIDQNWQRKFGELDIVAKKDDVYYFVEVKTTQSKSGQFLPEDHLDDRKVRKLEFLSHMYTETYGLEDYDNKLSAVFVYLDPETKEAKVDFWEQIF